MAASVTRGAPGLRVSGVLPVSAATAKVRASGPVVSARGAAAQGAQAGADRGERGAGEPSGKVIFHVGSRTVSVWSAGASTGSAMVLMGRADWWLPRWLDRVVPRLRGE